MIEVQLFARSGEVVTTVSMPRGIGAIFWSRHLYVLTDGRYVETSFFASTEPAR